MGITEILELYFDFANRTSAVLRQKIRKRDAIFSRAQSRYIPDFGRETLNIIGTQSKLTQFWLRKSKSWSKTVERYLILAKK